MKIGKWVLLKDKSDEAISARAFNIGRVIEGIIDTKSDQALAKNRMLEGKILEWYAKTKDKEFAKFMNIKTDENNRD